MLHYLRQSSQATSTRRAGIAAQSSSPARWTVTIGGPSASTALYGRDYDILCYLSPGAANLGLCCGCWPAGSEFKSVRPVRNYMIHPAL